jgi:FkbM family methyltransferase
VNQYERLGAIVENYRRYFGDKANVVIDAGTRDGDDAEFLRQELNAERVIAIDANPAAVYKTRAKYPAFEVIETALSNYECVAEFDQVISNRADFAGSSSLTKTFTFPGSVHNTISVQVTRIDRLLDGLKVDGLIDVIKVDLEGYSYEFLEGLGERIKDVKVMHLETETFERHEGHKDNQAVKRYMEERGFMLVDVSYEWGPTIEDQLFVNSALAVD